MDGQTSGSVNGHLLRVVTHLLMYYSTSFKNLGPHVQSMSANKKHAAKCLTQNLGCIKRNVKSNVIHANFLNSQWQTAILTPKMEMLLCSFNLQGTWNPVRFVNSQTSKNTSCQKSIDALALILRCFKPMKCRLKENRYDSVLAAVPSISLLKMGKMFACSFWPYLVRISWPH